MFLYFLQKIKQTETGSFFEAFINTTHQYGFFFQCLSFDRDIYLSGFSADQEHEEEGYSCM